MILVDSSVFIDHYRGVRTSAVDRLHDLSDDERLGIPDLVLTEVLQGFASKRAVKEVTAELTELAVVDVGGRECALQAAQNYRVLRTLGVTVRSTIDTLIATRCLLDGHALLYSDRDYHPFVEHLGLRSALAA